MLKVYLRSALGILGFLKQMGFRYTLFRIGYAFQIWTGILTLRFPRKPETKSFILLGFWRDLPVHFFFDPKDIQVPKNKRLSHLKENAANISQNLFQYFSADWFAVEDWHTNPVTQYRYDAETHWSRIPDFSREAGDIKYVWEKSRFAFLYDLIRYDYHFEKDQSKLVFELIENWIDTNPVNCGPNWKCGQEIALRVLNWVFALHYYRFSNSLNQSLFDKMIGSIHQQMRRVNENLDFALIAVRNNHALTETAALYTTGLLLPFFPESTKWKEKGKRIFEKEIAYQIYPDGTFLQFSMNYHRVALQLLTCVSALSKLNGEVLDPIINKRAEKSLFFLLACQDRKTGMLPNYGNNDGALFFPLTSCHFRDFCPQLAALANVLEFDLGYEKGIWDEEKSWITSSIKSEKVRKLSNIEKQAFNFPKGGYYVLRDDSTLTFLRCGAYFHRPFQSDNLHLDIWVNGENILRDAGSYLYSADDSTINYFSGTASHNTVMLGNYDQMTRVSRFAWADWVRIAGGHTSIKNDVFTIQAAFQGYKALGSGIIHHRKVVKLRGKLHWVIEDDVENAPTNMAMHQIWHPSSHFFEHYEIMSEDKDGIEIFSTETTGWFSETYGKKEESRRLVFSTSGRFIRTVICLREL